AKLGVVDFLRKPLVAAELKKSISENIRGEKQQLAWSSGQRWLLGEGPRIKKLLAGVELALAQNKDVVICAAKGIERTSLAELIHNNSPKKGKLVVIDLNQFRQETLETHFWATVRKLISLPDANSPQGLAERCQTLLLDNLDSLEEHFRLSLLKYFQQNKNRTLRIILGFAGHNSPEGLENSIRLEIPSLSDRQEDLPGLLADSLSFYAQKYNKKINSISAEALQVLGAYDWPGNYLELAKLIEGGVLNAAAAELSLADLPLGLPELIRILGRHAWLENLPLKDAQREFEKTLYQLLLAKTNNDLARAARFLDVPKTFLVERIENLVN
ncbi:MAG: sigma 54-interacting transcriptional regulator, partial [bacterium]